jgi:hypothetical protein
MSDAIALVNRMNLTLEQFLSGCDRSAKELPEVLATWADLDETLRREYAEAFIWMLESMRSLLVGLIQASSKNDGVAELLQLWAAESDPLERGKIARDMQDLLSDLERPKAGIPRWNKIPPEGFRP